LNKYLTALLLLLVLSMVHADYESSLKSLGFEGIQAQGVEAIECSDFVFSLEDPGTEFTPILSVNAEFKPSGGTASISALLNEASLGLVKPADFQCGLGGCWARIDINRNIIKKDNALRLCAKTGQSVIGVEIFNETKIGFYKQPVFAKENFVKCILLESGECVQSHRAALGEDLNITISLFNSGSSLSVVDFNNRKELAGEKAARKEIGQTRFEGLINAGETKTITYIIRIEEAVQMSLPPAIASFTNAFNETKSLTSNVVLIEPMGEPRLNTVIGVESIDNDKKQAKLSFTVFNKEIVDIKNIELVIETGKLTVLEGTTEHSVNSLEPKQAETITLLVQSAEAGEFPISCNFSAEGLTEKNCESVTVSFYEEDPTLLIAATIVIALLAVGIYLFIQTREDYKE